MKNSNINPLTIEEVNAMSREQLIFDTTVGSLIAFNNYESFYYRKAIFNILKDAELTAEVCNTLGLTVDLLETLMTARVNEEVSVAIGDRLMATEPQPMW
jgi:hypothetical protein